MKYIKIFENFNSNIVYHFTEMINLYYILEENKLKAYRYFYNDFPNLYKKEHISKRMKFISLTRNKFLNTPNNIKNMGLEDQELLVRMDLDLNKISQKYKVISVDYFDDKIGKRILKKTGKKADEQEEAVLTNEIDNIKQYIVSVSLPNINEFVKSYKNSEFPDYFYNNNLNFTDFGDIDFYKKLYINIIENINALIKNTAIEININD